MVEFGYFALLASFVLSLYGLGAGLVTLFRPSPGLLTSGRNALVAVNICFIVASGVFLTALFGHDFSVQYVYRNSAIDMPLLYLLTSFWGALEGSHMLWSLLLSSVITVALTTLRPRNQPLLPGLLVGFGLALSFMTLLAVWASSPFARQFPVPYFGAGLNPLLQNPYMAAHPPSLFTGYSSLVVPFGYGLAALLRGNFTPDWNLTVRRWALFAWMVLSVGIFLGGKWAYVELGWAGYWAWDPVENSSFMPWLSISAALHSLLVLDKTGRLPRLTVFLSMFGFILTFMGTFITRSGIVSSVHAFAESNIGPAYLTYIVTLLLITLLLLSTRGSQLQGAGDSGNWVISRESGLLFTNFFLLFLLALVLTGTLLPLVVEAIKGTKISIQQPFFNAFAPWIGGGLVALLGVGNLLRWRSGKLEDPGLTLLAPLVWSGALVGALWWKKGLEPRSAFSLWLIAWTAGVLVMDFVYRFKAIRFNTQAMWRFNKPYLGSWLVHMGFLVAMAGFTGNWRGLEVSTTLNQGEHVRFHGYELTFDRFAFREGSNVQQVVALVSARDASGETVVIEPTRAKYSNKEEMLTEVGLHSTFWHDLYLVLEGFDVTKKQASLKIHLNPMVKFVWTSLVMMVMGAALGLLHMARKRSLDAEVMLKGGEDPTLALIREFLQRNPSGKASAAATMALLVALTLGAFAPLATGQRAYAQSLDPTPVQSGALGSSPSDAKPAPTQETGALFQVNPLLQDIGQELRCPTCQGVSIMESGTQQSLSMRLEIEKQLSLGKSKPEVLEYFRQRYGDWILREPSRSSLLGWTVWVFPVAGLILGPMVLALALRSSRRREQMLQDALKSELKAHIERLKSPEKEAQP